MIPTDNPIFLEAIVVAHSKDRINNTCSVEKIVRGAAPRPTSVQLRTNDYLGVARDPRLIGAEVEALLSCGHGDAISRIFVSDSDDIQGLFEQRMAQLLCAESAVLGPSGFGINTGLIQSIASPDIPVYIDLMAHASLWEGIALARAKARAFRHNDAAHLEREVRKYGPGVIVVDALYSTTGTFCRLDDIVSISEAHGCVLVVDETHSFGVQGPNGAGVVVERNLHQRVHFRTIGLSKAMAGRGGILACSARNANFVRYSAFSLIFSTSVLAHEVAGFNAVLDIIASEPWRQDRVRSSHAKLCAGLNELGYNVDYSDAQIIALKAGTESNVLRLRNALEENDVFGSVFCAPATLKDQALVRLSVNAGITQGQLDHVLAVCARVRDQVGLSDWKSTQQRKGWSAYSPTSA